MKNHFSLTTLKSTPIASLVLFLAISLAWGASYYSKSKVIGVEEGGLIRINANAEAYIPPGALDDYLFKEGVDRVKIIIEMIDLEGDVEVGNIEPVIQALEGLILTLQGLIKESSDQGLIEESSDNQLFVKKIEEVIKYVQEAIDSLKSSTPDAQSVVRGLKQAMSRIDVATKHGLDTVQAAAYKDQLEEASGHFVFINGLLFVFGPSGVRFDPPLELTLTHTDFDEEMVLLGGDGELLEYTLDESANKVTFKIPHFSRYSYDHYDY